MLDALRTEASSCTRCALSQSRTQVVFGNGHPNADLMFVGEAPGFHEDQQGIPFVGQAGKLLDKLLAGIGLDARRRLRREHAEVPPARQPRPAAGGEAPASRWLFRQIELIRPKVDRHARQPRDQAADRQGDRDHARPRRAAAGRPRLATVTIFPLYHPAAALYTPAMLKVLEEDFAKPPGAARAGRSSRRRRSPAEPEPASPPQSRPQYNSACSDRDRVHARPRRPRRSPRASPRACAPGDVVAVSGELGSGKTTFVRGACRALGVTRAGDEPDLHDRPPLRGPRAVSHLDLYRFEGVSRRPTGARSSRTSRTRSSSSSGRRRPGRRCLRRGVRVRLSHVDERRRLIVLRRRC